VNKDGKVQFKYQGFVGKACLIEADKLQQLLKSMGLDTTVEKIIPTEEMYQVEREKVKIGNSSS
jgi:hypothetical protein